MTRPQENDVQRSNAGTKQKGARSTIRPWVSAFAGALIGSFLSAAPVLAQSADPALRVVAIDVEGGAATLYITPQGHSLLVDTGWPAGLGGPRAGKQGEAPAYVLNSAERIVAAAKAEGLSRIDYVLVTHYHVDHVGAVADLLKLFPVGALIDHGPNRENPAAGAPPSALTLAPSTLYPAYLKAIEGLPRRIVNPGDVLDIDGLHVTVTNAAGALVTTSLPGAGAPGIGCASAVPKAEDGGDENSRSIGLFMTWGKARIFAGGDSIWNSENAMVCPTNRIGTIDLYVANHHGSALSNSPAFLKSLAPRVVIFDNGPTKGADAESFDSVRGSPRLKALWQLHMAERSADKNEPEAHIANLKGGEDGFTLKAQVKQDGSISVTNSRTKQSETYVAGK